MGHGVIMYSYLYIMDLKQIWISGLPMPGAFKILVTTKWMVRGKEFLSWGKIKSAQKDV